MSNTYGFNVPSFFGGDSPGDLSYEQLMMRRKIAAALAARQRGFPKNLGEGLTYFGEALGDRLEMMRLARLEKAYTEGKRGLLEKAPPMGTPSQAQPAAPAGVAPPPRAYTPPVPPPARAPAAAIDEEDPSRPSALDLAPPSPIDGGGAPSPLAGPRQRAMEMETLDPAVANEMDRAAVYPQGAAPPSVESAEPPRQPSPDPRGSAQWQQMNADRIRRGERPVPPPDPALMRPSFVGPPPLTPGAMEPRERPRIGPDPAIQKPEIEREFGPRQLPSVPPLTPGAMSPRSEGGSSVDQFKAASAKLESGGRYDLLGPPVRTGGGIHRAYGKYQVMDFNIPKWTEKYLGERMSPEEFLRNPQAQERVYEGEFGRLAEKYGPEGASRAWIGGEGGMNNLNRRAIDASGRPIGLSVGEYGARFANAIGEQPTRAAAAEGVRPPTRPAAPSAVTQGDLDSDLLLAETVGVAGAEPAARPQVAAYAPDTASDALPVGLPMGYLPDMADTVQARRGAISGRLPQPPMTAPVPGPAGGEPAAPAQRLAQMPTLGGSPAIPDASMFSPFPTPGGQQQPPPIAPAPAAPPPAIAPAPPPGAVPPLAARPPGIAPAPPPGAFAPPAAQPPGIAPAPPPGARPQIPVQQPGQVILPSVMDLSKPLKELKAPKLADPSPREDYFRRAAASTPDPVFSRQLSDEADRLKGERERVYAEQKLDYDEDKKVVNEQIARREQMAIDIAKTEREEQRRRASPEYALELQEKQQKLVPTGETQAPVTGYDTRLGTPESPQRTGIPNADPRPARIPEKEWATAQVPLLIKKVETLDKASQEFQQTLDLINAARTHPGRKYGLGLTSAQAARIGGSDAIGFAQINEQLKGGAFLQAYNTLRGGGAISAAEGEKATVARARLNAAQSPRDYDVALKETEAMLRRDMERAQRQMNKPVTAWARPGAREQIAPDIGEIRKGMRYKGGDPEQPSSWEEP